MQKTSTNLISRVLLIETDNNIFDHLKSALEYKNIFVEWAKNSEEGFQKAKQNKPDVIITDIAPKLNGFDIIKKIRMSRDIQNPEFIVISEWKNTAQIIDQCFLNALGIKQYLIKSNYSDQELANEIKSILV